MAKIKPLYKRKANDMRKYAPDGRIVCQTKGCHNSATHVAVQKSGTINGYCEHCYIKPLN